MAVSITKLMFLPLLAAGAFLATINSSAAQICEPGEPFLKNCSCPWHTHLAGYVNKTQYGTVGCGYPCPACLPDEYLRPYPLEHPSPSDDSATKYPTVTPTNSPSKADEHTHRMPTIGNVPWGISEACLPALKYLVDARVRGVHGAIAVTKDPINGGCGHSWSPGSPSTETHRAQAMAFCEKYGPDCRIVYEQ